MIFVQKQGFGKGLFAKVLLFQKNMHTFAATVPTTLPICTANQGGTFAFDNPNNRIFKDGTWWDLYYANLAFDYKSQNYKKSLAISNIQRIFATIIKERKAIWKQKTRKYKFIP